PGRRPINPARRVTVTVPAPSGESAAPPPQRRLRLVTGRRPPRRAARRRGAPAVVRRRRVFAALVLLNAIELVGVMAVGPGFWISFAVTGTLLGIYLVHLRNRALVDRRRRRVQAREAAWLAARQAEVRREQARRAAARRETQRRLAAQKEAVRRAAMGLDREPSDLPVASNGGSVSYRRRGGLRGRPYEAGGRHHTA
ncbi:divisome protein SepX/GlpR, partial [Actinoplanes siamensis]